MTSTSPWSANVTAMEAASFLTRFAKSVTVVHRRSPRASQVMQNRAFSDKISFAFDSEIAELHESETKLSGLTLRGTLTGATRWLDVTGQLIAIDHDPRTALFTGQLDLRPRPRGAARSARLGQAS